MARVQGGNARRLAQERNHDHAARREAVRRNAARGIGPNLEEAVRLLRSADEFREAFRSKP